VPRSAVEPAQACSVNSVAGRSAHGPERPNQEIESSDVAGLRAATAGHSRPAARPRLSTTTSAGSGGSGPRQSAERIAAAGVLDLADVRAGVRQELGRVRPRDAGGELENAEPGEGRRHASVSGTWSSP